MSNLKELVREIITKEVTGRGRAARFSEKSGLSAGVISRIVNGEAGPTLDNLPAIARGFGCEPWQLLSPDFDPDATAAAALESIKKMPGQSEIQSALVTALSAVQKELEILKEDPFWIAYGDLSPDKQKVALDYLKSLADQSLERSLERAKKVLPPPLQSQDPKPKSKG